MTIRKRISLTAAGAVAIAVLLASIGAYFGVRANLIDQIDSSLKSRAEGAQIHQTNPNPPNPLADPEEPEEPEHELREIPDLPEPGSARFGGAAGLVQIVFQDGHTERPGSQGSTALPVDDKTRQIANGKNSSFFTNTTVDGKHLRIYVTGLDGIGAIQVARPLDEVDDTLSDLITLLIVVTLLGTTLAAVLGGMIASTSLKPIRRFADQTEQIANTHAINRRIDIESNDEVGRLAHSFNSTLDELENSVTSQRQLVADASHELRTPLASIKTNIQLLQRDQAITTKDSQEVFSDVIEQVDELTALTGDIVELARRGEEIDLHADDIDLAELTAATVKRAQLHWPKVEFVCELEPFVVRGIAQRLDRAIYNLIDNAAKWSADGGRIELTLTADGELTVRDHGPGFKDADLPHVFDRFYRATEARSLRGSGLGLAIVRQVVESHGGSIVAENAETGGALLRVTFPTS